MSSFEHVELAPTDAIFLVKANYDADPFEGKIDVGIGAYRDDNGKPFVLNVVRKAERMLLEDKTENKEYLGIGGLASFIKGAQKFAFGATSDALKSGRVATVQTLSGTGALRVGFEFIGQFLDNNLSGAGNGVEVYIPNPTWGNHMDICMRTRLAVKRYRYYKPATKALDFEGMMEDISSAKPGSVILLHMCAHNPTGVDPSEEQWQEIAKVCAANKLVPFFDAAYQGFASGDCDRDAYALRLFESEGMELFLAQSFSKNMGLYGERIGALSIVCNQKKIAEAVDSQLKKIIRAAYSNPPKHGAGIASRILNDPVLFKEWMIEMTMMTDRMKAMRAGLRSALEKNGAPGDWSFITNQIGMFTYTGLAKGQVERLQKEFHIYMPNDGRISIAGLTPTKLEYAAKAIKSVL